MFRCFNRRNICKRVLSMTLAIVMFFTMFAGQLPSGLLEVKAAENATNITVHFDNSVWNWSTPGLQYWGGTSTTVTGGEAARIDAWSVDGYKLQNDGDNWYSVTLQGDFEGFQFLDYDDANSHNTGGKGFSSYMAQYAGETPQDLYYKPGQAKWYIDAACTTELAPPPGTKVYEVTIHYNNENKWNDVYAYSWNADGNPNGGWPGEQISENAEHANWYDVTISGLTSALLNFKYTNNAGAETNNYDYTLVEDSTELWVEKGSVLTSAPTSWTNPDAEPDIENVEVNGEEVTFRYYAPDVTSVGIAGTMNGWNKEEAIPLTKGDDGVWTGTFTYEASNYEFKFVINGEYEGGNNRSFEIIDESAPEIENIEIDGTSVTFRYYAPNATSVHVSGTMNGWNTSATPLTKGEDGIWTGTFTYAAGGYSYKFVINGNYEGGSDRVFEVVDENAPEIISPEVNGTSVTFRYYAPDANEIRLAGDMTDWQTNAVLMTKGEDGVWTYTTTLSPKKYGYKFIADGKWTADPENLTNPGDYETNSVVVVSGLCDSTASLTKGKVSELPAKLDYYDANGTKSQLDVTYEVADSNLASHVEFDTSASNKVTVLGTYTEDEIAFTAKAANGATATVTATIYDVQYTYTIYAYSDSADRMSLTDSALYVWDPVGNSLDNKDHAFIATEKLADGNNWLKMELTLGCTNLGMIFKSAGKWASDGGWQTPDLLFTNKAENDCTLYVIDGHTKVYESLDDIPTADERRYLVVEYTNADNNYADMMVYTWANGIGDLEYPIELVNGKYIAKIPVADSETEMNVGLIVKRGTGWGNDGDNKEGGDNFVVFPANQRIVKVKFAGGKVTSEYPYNVGAGFNRTNNTVNFFYRDEAAFRDCNLASLNGKVSVVVKSSTGNSAIDGTYAMTYDAVNDRFTAFVPLTDDTDYYYYYSVNGKVVLDAFNENTITLDGVEYSKLRNKTYALDMSASIANASMDYNDNNLLSVDWVGKNGASLEGFVVKELYADLSALGLGRKVAIDPALKTLAIGCDQNVAPGEKTITVTLKDDCDMTYTAQATVTVVERTKTAGDFDWDEAVIYFAVTDRFFDGDARNNTVTGGYDAADGTNNSRYHGGDLVGLKTKIDYLYELGVNTIWLTPVVDNIDQDVTTEVAGYESYGYHGYWASNFTEMNPHLGSKEELQALIDAAHAKGMKIMVDVVLNHSGYGTEEYFNNLIQMADGSYLKMIRGIDETVPGDDKLSSSSTAGLPDFMTEIPEVRNQVIAWQTAWMKDFDIDYYRVDTVKHVDNTTWAAFKNALAEENPDFKLIGEYYGANYTNATQYQDAGNLDSLLDFDFKDYARNFVMGNLLSVETTLAQRDETLSNTSTLGQFLSSHDETGLLTNLKKACGGDAAKAEALMKVASSLQITAKGQPVIYYGEEIGLTGENNYPYQTNRYDFDWNELASQKNEDDSFYHHYKTMLNIRKTYSEVFAKGDRNIVAVSDADGYDIVRRSYNGKNLYVALNVKSAAKSVTFETLAEAGSVYKDLYSNTEYTVSANGTVTITIPAAADGGTAVLALTSGKENAVVDNNKITLKLHYNRPDGNYADWDAWMWGDKVGGNGYAFVEENGSMVATITVDGRTESKINYIIRKGGGDWKEKDVDADQSIDVSDIVSGTVHFYVESGKAGGTRLLGADAIKGSKIISSMYNRDTNTVTVVTSVPVSGNKDTAFAITRYDGVTIGISKVLENDCTYTLTLENDLTAMSEMLKEYTLHYDKFDYALGMPSVYSSDEFEAAYTYAGNDLGATWTKDATTFKVWAPTAENVQVALYKSGTEGTADLIKKVDMTAGEKGVWTVKVDGDLNGTYYTYFVTVNGETEEACDPYARTTGVNGKRAMVIDLDSTNPKGWDKDISPNKDMTYTDAVIYELHVRDASIHESSGVSVANKGKFLGLTETGTITEGGVPTALDHIADMGVTHVHLLPVYDYGSVDETKLDVPQFNWGYDPVNYNVPEGSYSTDPYNGEVRVKEMKEMVMTLHENNINVIMDVVYNHVYDAGSYCFNEIVPKYFSRTFADGSYVSGSGCGNDTASERSMVQKYIIDSVMYWAEEYHIDGFRFDLVGLLDTETMNKVIDTVHEKYPDVIFYGEGWEMAQGITKENVSMATQKNAYLTPELAYFSDTIRNLLAGDNSAVNPGYVSGLTGKEEAIADCYTADTSWCPDPVNTVNYASCHDNYTLMDKLNKSRADASKEDRIKMNNLAAAIYMMSEGIPFIHAGEEFLRTKIDENGEVIHNSYNSSDYVNALRWNHLEDETYADVVDYYKGLIEFRKNHESLRLTTSDEVAANVTYHWVTNEVVLFSLKGKDSVAGEASDGIVVIFNPTTSAKEISLYNYGSIAEGNWQVCIDDENAGTDVLATITDGKVTVDPISAMVLVLGDTVDTDSVYIDNYREPSEEPEDTEKPENPEIEVPGEQEPENPDIEEPEDTEKPDIEVPGEQEPEDTPDEYWTPTLPTVPSEPEKPVTPSKPGSTIKLPSKEELGTVEKTIEVVLSADATMEEKAEKIVAAVKDVKEGNDVVVKLSGTESESAEIPVAVFVEMEANKNKDINLVIELANGFIWTINANSIQSANWAEDLESIDFWVDIVEKVVPAELVNSVVAEKQTAVEISLKHNGPFGLTAALDIPVGSEFAGRSATLYYFNAEANAMEEQGTEKIDEAGNVRYLFTHASDYVIVIEEATDAESDLDLSVESTEKVEDTEIVETEAQTAEDGGSVLPIIIIVCIVLCAAVFVLLQKKKSTIK